MTTDGPAVQTPAPPRRRANRPPTVPLSEFGKEPPAPPPVRLSPRQIAIGLIVTAVVLTVLWIAIVWAGGIGTAKWSQTRCLDVRVQC
jgi:hypothetical protein